MGCRAEGNIGGLLSIIIVEHTPRALAQAQAGRTGFEAWFLKGPKYLFVRMWGALYNYEEEQVAI